ncbi:trypsin Inhibitor like cysteine rich domain protein, partial [Teladorsagia circumcincta]
VIICMALMVIARNEEDQIAILRPVRRCFANEEFTECASMCPPTCRHPTPGFCSLRCVPGCQCKSGFMKNGNGACVANCTDTSSNICPENEEFKQCGTACEPSCENPKPMILIYDIISRSGYLAPKTRQESHSVIN